MLDITDFTSTDEIRSTVGLSSDHLPDDVILLEIYSNVLELALDNLDMSDPALTPVKDEFFNWGNDPDKTDAYNLTRLFATYTVALEVATSLSMRTPKSHSDSKVTLTRFSPENTWRDVIEAIKGKLIDITNNLENVGSSDADEQISMFSSVKPAYDPITGEG